MLKAEPDSNRLFLDDRPIFAGHMHFSFTAAADCAVPTKYTALPDHRSNLSSQRLYQVLHAVSESACVVEGGAEATDVLNSLHRLAQRVHGTYGRPKQLIHVRWQPPMPWLIPASSADSATPVQARLDIWLAEALFTMRSDYDIWLMMSKLTPCKPLLPRPLPPPRRPLPPKTPLAYRFSLAGLMRSMESAGYAEANQP